VELAADITHIGVEMHDISKKLERSMKDILSALAAMNAKFSSKLNYIETAIKKLSDAANPEAFPAFDEHAETKR
jgi:hypothetical protein